MVWGLGDGGGLFIGALPFYSRTLTSSIPAKAGISLLAEAGRATLAPLRVVICAGGAGIGRFPLSREWKGGAGMEGFFIPRLFLRRRTPLFHSREGRNLGSFFRNAIHCGARQPSGFGENHPKLALCAVAGGGYVGGLRHTRRRGSFHHIVKRRPRTRRHTTKNRRIENISGVVGAFLFATPSIAARDSHQGLAKITRKRGAD